jgi:hypothetical protein
LWGVLLVQFKSESTFSFAYHMPDQHYQNDNNKLEREGTFSSSQKIGAVFFFATLFWVLVFPFLLPP